MALLHLTSERPDSEIAKSINATALAAEAQFTGLRFEGPYPESGIGIQDIRAKQVGLANNVWQMTITTSFADWVNKTLGTDNFLIVTGVFNLTVDPSTTEIFPKANGKDLPIVSLEQLYADTQRSGAWFQKPFSVRPSNNLTIQAVGRVAQTERLGLLGYCIGKRSYLIDATPA